MKIAYFDCQFGAAGDMLLGALLAAGVPFSEWKRELGKLDLPAGSFTVAMEDVIRCSISCKKVIIQAVTDVNQEVQSHRQHHARHKPVRPGHDEFGLSVRRFDQLGPAEHPSAQQPSTEQPCQEPALDSLGHGGHSHEDGQSDHRHDQHGHGHGHGHEGNARTLSQILQLIENSDISYRAKRLSTQIFNRLGQVEARVHGVPIDQVHFHEIGAIDSIVDIVGFAIAYDMLQIEKSYVSPLPLGSGTVNSRHGIFPVPAPAAVLLLSDAGASISGRVFHHECLTPTGAAILATIATQWSLPPMERIETIGYGAGTFNPPEFPNACRVFLAHAKAENEVLAEENQHERSVESLSFRAEIIAVLEANLDDLSPQSISYAMDRLLEAGALDVSVLPAVMKKGRSGHILSVICHLVNKAELERIILTQTSSLGVRSYLADRLVAEREWQEVTIGNGARIRIKIARDLNGNIINAQPEYDDCAAYATITGIPLKEVIVDALTNLKHNELDR